MKKLLFVLLALAVLAAPGVAFAGDGSHCGKCSLDFKASPWTSKATWGEQAVGKLEFGIKNIFTGWTEVFTEPMDAYKNHTCVVKGFFHGVANAVLDTAGGVLHLATFPITQLDVPLPQGGSSLGS